RGGRRARGRRRGGRRHARRGGRTPGGRRRGTAPVMTPAAATGRRRGRRRSEAADDAILAATLELLPERGYRALAMAAVIERAGVSSATLYRRWTTKHDLVVAALATLVPDPVDVDTG